MVFFQTFVFFFLLVPLKGSVSCRESKWPPGSGRFQWVPLVTMMMKWIGWRVHQNQVEWNWMHVSQDPSPRAFSFSFRSTWNRGPCLVYSNYTQAFIHSLCLCVLHLMEWTTAGPWGPCADPWIVATEQPSINANMIRESILIWTGWMNECLPQTQSQTHRKWAISGPYDPHTLASGIELLACCHYYYYSRSLIYKLSIRVHWSRECLSVVWHLFALTLSG